MVFFAVIGSLVSSFVDGTAVLRTPCEAQPLFRAKIAMIFGNYTPSDS